MALLKYFKPRQNANSLPDHKSCPSLTKKELKAANDSVSKRNTKLTDHQNYNAYPAEENAQTKFALRACTYTWQLTMPHTHISAVWPK